MDRNRAPVRGQPPTLRRDGRPNRPHLLDERNLVTDAAQRDEETEKNLGVLFPQTAEDYREARGIRARAVGCSAGEEESSASAANDEMREAVRRYRAVYERFVEG